MPVNILTLATYFILVNISCIVCKISGHIFSYLKEPGHTAKYGQPQGEMERHTCGSSSTPASFNCVINYPVSSNSH
jgi:hypothetical protein